MSKEKNQEQGDVLSQTKDLEQIVVYNDEVNSFEHVIDCFVKILEIDIELAIRYTMEVHYSGKCGVKEGTYDELEPYALRLMEKQLSCKIE